MSNVSCLKFHVPCGIIDKGKRVMLPCFRMDTQVENKKLYELSYFITPDLKDEEAVSHAHTVKNLIVAHSGEIDKEEAPRKRPLAYPISRKTHGYFGYFHFLANPSAVREITGALSLDARMLRHLLITVGKKQIAQMQKPFRSIAVQEKMKKKAMEKEKIAETIFKEGAPQLEEKKVEMEELDKKLEEILNK